mgnify:FL=1
MAHELVKMADGTWSMARATDTAVSWHALENVVDPNNFDAWFDRSGMNFTIERSRVEFDTGMDTIGVMPDKHVLYRSDTLQPLSVVSDGYKVVQPRQVLEFFRDLCEKNHLKMDTAGVIQNGVKFWAMASTGEQLSVGHNDIIKQYILLATSADYSMATIAKHTNHRVVCSNTFHASISNGEEAVRIRHSKMFDETEVKLDLGLLAEDFTHMGRYAKELNNIPVSVNMAVHWIAELLEDRILLADEVEDVVKSSRVFKKFWRGYTNGPGANETLWGLFNGVTYTVDHVNGRSLDTRMNSAWFGAGNTLKERAWAKVIEVINGAKQQSTLLLAA